MASLHFRNNIMISTSSQTVVDKADNDIDRGIKFLRESFLTNYNPSERKDTSPQKKNDRNKTD